MKTICVANWKYWYAIIVLLKLPLKQFTKSNQKSSLDSLETLEDWETHSDLKLSSQIKVKISESKEGGTVDNA